MNFKKAGPFLFIVVLAILVFTVKNCQQHLNSQQKETVKLEQTTTDSSGQDLSATRGLNRHPQRMHYSKHAKCRMECRHIDEAEIKEILETGTINYRKSELQGDACRKKYAVEGLSKDHQKLRIIFAPCGNEITVVTCIDLGVEWACDCK